MEDVTVERWREPAPMDTGAPEPILVQEGDRLWVAYLARDPQFPGWEHPSVTDYLDANPGEPFAVIRFDGVTGCTLGPPNDERLHEHPLYERGLRCYAFHRIRHPGTNDNWWIVAFHDETLDVRAGSAKAFPMRYASSPEAAIALARAAG
jgi:hypothetical protein